MKKILKWGAIGFVALIVLAFLFGSSKENTTTSPVSTESVEMKENTVTDVQESNETVSQKNAVRKAKSYLSFSGFSRDGLITQLEFEKFSNEDAVYGADNSGADWNEEAAQKAKSYMDMQGYSREGLIKQLMFEKFTEEQANYGADAVGL